MLSSKPVMGQKAQKVAALYFTALKRICFFLLSVAELFWQSMLYWSNPILYRQNESELIYIEHFYI